MWVRHLRALLKNGDISKSVIERTPELIRMQMEHAMSELGQLSFGFEHLNIMYTTKFGFCALFLMVLLCSRVAILHFCVEWWISYQYSSYAFSSQLHDFIASSRFINLYQIKAKCSSKTTKHFHHLPLSFLCAFCQNVILNVSISTTYPHLDAYVYESNSSAYFLKIS